MLEVEFPLGEERHRRCIVTKTKKESQRVSHHVSSPQVEWNNSTLNNFYV